MRQGPPSDSMALVLGVTTSQFGKFTYVENDSPLGDSVREYGEWRQLETNFLCQFIHPGDVVIESRAGVGTRTQTLASMVGPSGIVHAFEPDPRLAEILKSNLDNGAFKNVRIIQNLLGAKTRPIQIMTVSPLTHSDLSQVLIAQATSTVSDDSIATKTVALDDFPSIEPTMIVVDSGQTLNEVLQGAKVAIQKVQPIIFVNATSPTVIQEALTFIDQQKYSTFIIRTPFYQPENFHQNPVNAFMGHRHLALIAIPDKTHDLISREFRIEIFPIDQQEDVQKFLEVEWGKVVFPTRNVNYTEPEFQEQAVLGMKQSLSDLEFREQSREEYFGLQIESLQSEIASILNSKSWLITRPIRYARRLVDDIRKLTRNNGFK